MPSCVLVEDCNQPDYIKLAKALYVDHGFPVLRLLAIGLGYGSGEGGGYGGGRDSGYGDGKSRVERGGAKDKDEKSDDEYLAEADEEESDLDLAWKMLDVAIAATRVFCYL
ncbi:hypothetical protein SADUNF_Sadunf11G0008600 [Salix dunnii]|uniref:Uncharacterized protein n=1 Tax=Salix dunnii TaxID=1413687 RepID=A0A835JPD8_9ROSI|nr:hypothetical protein SADUNF_Sadunf11G0008600 [Salix dunnii]